MLTSMIFDKLFKAEYAMGLSPAKFTPVSKASFNFLHFVLGTDELFCDNIKFDKYPSTSLNTYRPGQEYHSYVSGKSLCNSGVSFVEKRNTKICSLNFSLKV